MAARWAPRPTPRLAVALATLVCMLVLPAARSEDLPLKTAKEAYATLLYSDDFLLGVRVLGQSLRETGTTRDLAVLATEGVSSQAADTLQKDGWKVHRVGLLANPGTWTQEASQARHRRRRLQFRFPARFYGVYTKLLIFNLTQYERVVYLDADAIAARNMDELFLCDGLCAVMRHSERGMLRAVATTPSYTGGDQGFLNAFLSDFPEAPLFDPRRGQLLSNSSSWRSAAPGALKLPLGRLPTLYNADLGLFIMNSNRWTLPADEIRVMHFTLATFKPWDWWAGWIMGEIGARWQALRSRLPPAADGRSGGNTAQQQLAALVLVPLPLLLVAALLAQQRVWQQWLGAAVGSAGSRVYRAAGAAGTRVRGLTPSRSRGAINGGSGSGSGSSSPQTSCRGNLQHLLLGEPPAAGAAAAAAATPAWLPAAAGVAGMGSVLVALTWTVSIIPRQVSPAVGVTLIYEWTALAIVLLYSLFLRACYRHGLRLGGGSGGWAVQPWRYSWTLLAVILGSLGMVPWWADLLGVGSFAGKAVTTFLLLALAGIVCTQCFISLATRWYQCGLAEAAAGRVVSKLDGV
ncbi:Inositol phosphorylceramide glucuronosyltransferase 1 [Chlorella vulgaris]